MPISAEPASDMIVRTSAKSRLIRPGIVIRSQMPWTPWRSTSSAILNASTIEVERSSTSSRRSFGITITVSHAARKRLDARVGRLAAPRAFEPERRRHDADGERAELARDPRDDRRAPVPGAATLAGGHEHHVGAAQRRADLVVRLLRRLAARLRIGAGAEALRQLLADMDLDRRVREIELLHVGVDGDEVDLRDAGVHHPVDCVDTAAADPDDADHGEVGRGLASDVQPRRALRHRLDEAAGGGLVRRLGLGAGAAGRGSRGGSGELGADTTVGSASITAAVCGSVVGGSASKS